jgi:hypothetical protein
MSLSEAPLWTEVFYITINKRNGRISDCGVRPKGMPMKNMDQIAQVGFSAVVSLMSATFGYGYHWVHYHNNVEHMRMNMSVITTWVTAVAPWVFLIPLAVLCTGIVWRRHPLVVLLAVQIGWLFAVTWPPLCLWVWEVPHTLM